MDTALLYVYSLGGIALWSAFLIGSVVIYRRNRSRPALLLAAAAGITCFGKLLMSLFRNFPTMEADSAGAIQILSRPPMFDIGLGLTGVGYFVIAVAFVTFALTQFANVSRQK